MRSKLSIVAIVMLPTIAFAQPIAPNPQLPPEVTLRVTQQELDVISEGLQSQPFGKVVVLINKLRQQIVDQMPKGDVKPAEAPK